MGQGIEDMFSIWVKLKCCLGLSLSGEIGQEEHSHKDEQNDTENAYSHEGSLHSPFHRSSIKQIAL